MTIQVPGSVPEPPLPAVGQLGPLLKALAADPPVTPNYSHTDLLERARASREKFKD